MAHRTLFLRLSRPTSCEEAEGSPKFLTLLSLHATLSDPGSSSGISPLRFLRAGFRHVKTVANCIVSIYGAESPRGGTSPLRPAMFSVYASQLLFAFQLGSFSRATLDTGCWLGFARQRLSPYKKRQAALGALTYGSVEAGFFGDPLQPMVSVCPYFHLAGATALYARLAFSYLLF